MKVYIAGPYRAATPALVDANIKQARDAMADLLRQGHTPFCPHSMSGAFERDYADIPDEAYLEMELEWLRLCDAILMLPGWEQSSGSLAEKALAEELDLPVYYAIGAGL